MKTRLIENTNGGLLIWPERGTVAPWDHISVRFDGEHYKAVKVSGGIGTCIFDGSRLRYERHSVWHGDSVCSLSHRVVTTDARDTKGRAYCPECDQHVRTF